MKNPDYIDLKELNNLPIRKQIEIKIKIIENNELDNIPVAYLPAVFVDEYYFISYSHLDYKKVYKDIFELQASGLNTWYDRGIPANKSWKDTAKKYILPYACKGVIFYISENSLKSNPVKDEIEYVIDSHKPFIVIVLPTIIDNQEVNLLPSKIADKLYKEQKIDQERYDFIKKIFTDERIYLSLSTLTTNKVEKIKMALPEEPLLMMDAVHSHIDFFDRNSFGEAIITIRSLTRRCLVMM